MTTFGSATVPCLVFSLPTDFQERQTPGGVIIDMIFC
jgi:hypothetical protein